MTAEKKNEIKVVEMQTQEAEKTRHGHDRYQWTPLFFALFPAGEEILQCLCFSFSHEVNFVVDTCKRQEHFKAARASDWHSRNAPRQQKCFFTAYGIYVYV